MTFIGLLRSLFMYARKPEPVPIPDPPPKAALEMTLERQIFSEESTIGELFIDGKHECWTLEDPVRTGPKIAGVTAIPAGTYDVRITWSPKFRHDVPLLLGVVGFEGVRIHIGNTPEDTQGCVLVGQTRGFDWIGRSQAAYDLLYAKLLTAQKAGLEMRITIR